MIATNSARSAAVLGLSILLSSAGCELFGKAEPATPPVERVTVVDPDATAPLVALPFADDDALHRTVTAESVLDRPVGSRGREFTWVGAPALCTTMSPDGSRLAVGTAEGGLRIQPLYGAQTPWESPADARVLDDKQVPPRPAGVGAVAFSPVRGSQSVVAVTRNGYAQIWLLGRDELPADSTPVRKNPATVKVSDNVLLAVACHPTRPVFAAAGADGIIRLLSIPDGRPLSALPADAHKNSVTALEFSPDGAYLASADEDGAVNLWRSDALFGPTAAAVKPVPLPSAGEPSAGPRGVMCLDFGPNTAEGVRLIAGTKDARLLLWQIPRGAGAVPVLLASDQRAESKHKNSIRSVAFSPDGRFAATGSSDGTAKIWLTEGDGSEVRELVDAKSGKIVREVSRQTKKMYLTAVSELAVGGAAGAGTGFRGEVQTVRFTSDALDLLAASDRTAALYRARRLDSRSLEVGNAGRRIDWTRPTPPADYLTSTALMPFRTGDTGYTIRVRINNTSQLENADLYQVIAETECFFPPTGDPNFADSTPVAGLHGRRIYFGKVPAKGSTTAEVKLVPQVALPMGDYVVAFKWRHAAQPEAVRGRETVTIPIGTERRPIIAVSFHLEEETGGAGDGILQFGERANLAVLIKNVGTAEAGRLKVTLAPAPAPGDELAPYSLSLADKAGELDVGDLRPGQVRRRIVGLLPIQAEGGAGGRALPQASLPLAMKISHAGAALPEERPLWIPVGPPLEETGQTRPASAGYRTRDPENRETAVIQFRTAPGVEAAVIAEATAGAVGPLVAEGVRDDVWLRVRLPAAAAQRLQTAEFYQSLVWVRLADLEPIQPGAKASEAGLRLVPFGADVPVIDHNLPAGRKIRGAQHTLDGVVTDRDGVKRISLALDGGAAKVLFAAEAGKPAPTRVPLPREVIDLSASAQREILLTAEDVGGRSQVLKIKVERDGN